MLFWKRMLTFMYMGATLSDNYLRILTAGIWFDRGYAKGQGIDTRQHCTHTADFSIWFKCANEVTNLNETETTATLTPEMSLFSSFHLLLFNQTL